MKKSVLSLSALALLTYSCYASAFTGAIYGASPTVVDGFKFNGFLRSFYFYNAYNDSENQRAFAVGGILNVTTPTLLNYFSGGLSFFTAHNLGIYNQTANSYDPLLMGDKSSINSLGQAYVQFDYHNKVVVRAGDQMLHNMPWLHSHDPMLLPDSYQAVYARIQPYKGVRLIGLREFKWQSRTSNQYYPDNYYYPNTYDGDSLYGGFGKLPTYAPSTAGTLAFGATYNKRDYDANLWYYDFYGFAKMFYASGGASDSFGDVKGNLHAQFLREYGSHSFLGNVDSVTYGAKAGLAYGPVGIGLAYNQNSPKPGSFLNGGVVSPYNIGALYTNSVIVGLVQLGGGHAYQVAASYQTPWNVSTNLSYADYHTVVGHSTELDWILNLDLSKVLKNFSITNLLSFDTGAAAPGGRDAYFEQFDVQYLF
ncbi:hypothetical protein AB4090_10575 [Acidithiobacillus sp. IBUN Pt1247-S3]|uniref:hypothetical protein n=1 Tax=Acidithiobacillus sp. IBUN Pt1247-S3 TaxID=3166642 RepID=UPI0034E5B2B1